MTMKILQEKEKARKKTIAKPSFIKLEKKIAIEKTLLSPDTRNLTPVTRHLKPDSRHLTPNTRLLTPEAPGEKSGHWFHAEASKSL